MLDRFARRLIDPPLDRLALRLARAGATANGVTTAGLAASLGCALCAANAQDGLAIALLALSRLADGLDGALARLTRKTDFGGYIDIVADFVFYGAVPLAFAWRDASDAPAAAALLFAFYVNGASFLAYAALAEKRGLTTRAQGEKSFYFAAGLAEGTETILVFLAMLLAPSWFSPIAWGFALACLIGAAARVAGAAGTFRDQPPSA